MKNSVWSWSLAVFVAVLVGKNDLLLCAEEKKDPFLKGAAQVGGSRESDSAQSSEEFSHLVLEIYAVEKETGAGLLERGIHGSALYEALRQVEKNGKARLQDVKALGGRSGNRVTGGTRLEIAQTEQEKKPEQSQVPRNSGSRWDAEAIWNPAGFEVTLSLEESAFRESGQNKRENHSAAEYQSMVVADVSEPLFLGTLDEGGNPELRFAFLSVRRMAPVGAHAESSAAQQSGGLKRAELKVDPKSLVQEKMKRIILPRVEFRDASLENAVRYLRELSVKLDAGEEDPARRGINLVIQQPEAVRGPVITLDLANVPMDAALKYVATLANVQCVVQDHAVVLAPMGATAVLLTKSFVLPNGWIEKVATRLPEPVRKGNDIREVFMALGVEFPEGATAAYTADSKRIVVRNTAENMDLLEALLEEHGSESTESRGVLRLDYSLYSMDAETARDALLSTEGSEPVWQKVQEALLKKQARLETFISGVTRSGCRAQSGATGTGLGDTGTACEFEWAWVHKEGNLSAEVQHRLFSKQQSAEFPSDQGADKTATLTAVTEFQGVQLIRPGLHHVVGTFTPATQMPWISGHKSGRVWVVFLRAMDPITSR